MTEKTTTQYTDENADDDFNLGFTEPNKTGPALVKVEGEEGEKKVEGDEDTDTPVEGAEGEDKAPVEGEEGEEGAPAEENVTVTKAQLERLLAAADKVDGVDAQISKLFGTTGDLKNLVKTLQEATPKGMKVEIPADAFKEMEEEYPAIAEHMKNVLGKALAGTKGTSDDNPAGAGDDKEGKGVKPDAIQAIVEEAVIRREMRVLNADHPNWRADVNAIDPNAGQKPDPKHPFRVWLKSQTADYQKEVNDTDSPLVVSRALDKFQSFKRAEARKAKNPPPDKKTAARNGRIEDAVTERGDGNPPPKRKSADDEFNEGYRTG